MSKPVVKIQNISKIYKLYDKPIDRMKEALNPFKKKYHKNFHALENISLELKRGEALGVIGRNGNGKSTLLKIIAGVLTPTKGQVNTKGKISAILELTSSLKPELTGMENIYFNLQISGFKNNEIDGKVKEIEEFADIGEFINQPVKSYSSGMKSRLGFGIATSVEPDILILDEVLAVGDFNFQQKCLAKINAMREEMTVIFVSHSMNSVRLFCDRVIVLEKGKLAYDGEPDKAIEYYLSQDEQNNKRKLSLKKDKLNKHSFIGDLYQNEAKITNLQHKWDKENYQLNEQMVFSFSFDLQYEPRNLVIGLPIWNQKGDLITSFNSDYHKIELYRNKRKMFGKLYTNCVFNPSKYLSVIAIVDGSEFLYRGLNNKFEISNRERVFGFVSLEHEWKINEL